MAAKKFTVNTEPHVADVGGTELRFAPEVEGGVFAEAYAALSEAQKGVAGIKPEDITPAALKAVSAALRGFVARFLYEAGDRDAYAALTLPDRVNVQLVEWLGGLYGGADEDGRGNGPSGSSSAS